MVDEDCIGLVWTVFPLLLLDGCSLGLNGDDGLLLTVGAIVEGWIDVVRRSLEFIAFVQLL